VASEKMDTDIVCVSVFINCGSRQETEETSGSAHFLEHLNFKGSEKRSRV
jgi:predicted Zn-dependent peptidase